MDPMDIQNDDDNLLGHHSTSASPGPEPGSGIDFSSADLPPQQGGGPQEMDITEEEDDEDDEPPQVIPEEVTLDSSDSDDDDDDIIPMPTKVDPRGSRNPHHHHNRQQQKLKCLGPTAAAGPGPGPGGSSASSRSGPVKPRLRPAKILMNQGPPPQVIDLTEDEGAPVILADDDIQDITDHQVPSGTSATAGPGPAGLGLGLGPSFFRPSTASARTNKGPGPGPGPSKGPSKGPSTAKDDDDDTPELIEVDPVPVSKEQ